MDIYVITTDSEHYHLEYAPPDPTSSGRRKLFLSYIAPIHYNVVVPAR